MSGGRSERGRGIWSTKCFLEVLVSNCEGLDNLLCVQEEEVGTLGQWLHREDNKLTVVMCF